MDGLQMNGVYQKDKLSLLMNKDMNNVICRTARSEEILHFVVDIMLVFLGLCLNNPQGSDAQTWVQVRITGGIFKCLGVPSHRLTVSEFLR